MYCTCIGLYFSEVINDVTVESSHHTLETEICLIIVFEFCNVDLSLFAEIPWSQ